MCDCDDGRLLEISHDPKVFWLGAVYHDDNDDDDDDDDGDGDGDGDDEDD